MLKISRRARKGILIWGLVGCAVPIFWGLVGFILFNAKESTWTNIYWYSVYITCPPWLILENSWSLFLTPFLNGVLYAGVALLVSAASFKQPEISGR
jgi:hypothetical protein